MDIRDFLMRFDDVIQCGSGNNTYYKARCPVHGDNKQSLSISEGMDGRILVNCFCKCDTRRILDAVGLTFRDIRGSGANAGSVSSPAKREKIKKDSPDKSDSKPKFKKNDYGEIVKYYHYTEADGTYRFTSARTTTKQFLQGVKDPSSWRGYNFKRGTVDPKLRDSMVYHLPEVAKARDCGGRVYVVEGEKDADNVMALGRIATTQACGAGHWKAGHTAQLKGAYCIVLPDNDGFNEGNANLSFVGQRHGWDVATKLTEIGNRVKLLNLLEIWPELPEKGDISDVIEHFGGEETLKKLDALEAATPYFDPNGRKWWLPDAEQDPDSEPETDYEKTCDAYDHVPGYCVYGGRMCMVNAKGEVNSLGGFVARVDDDIILDDGVDEMHEYGIRGWDIDGNPLRDVRVKAKDFARMEWVDAHWGINANISPARNAREHLRWVIAEVGRRNARRVKEYAHTGWRKISGKWCYLHAGGAIGAENVTVTVDDALRDYRMDIGREAHPEESAYEILYMKDFIKPEIFVPLYGQVFLVPLRHFLAMTDSTPRASVFLIGEQQSGKSVLASLALAHFRRYQDGFPCTFRDTSNSIEKLAFMLKDELLVIDDFFPASSARDRQQLNAIAQNLGRAFYDLTGRGRMNSDRTVSKTQAPRCLALMTGEDVPDINASGVSRFFVVRVKRTDICKDDGRLTAIQEMARGGMMMETMIGYIRWLMQKVDDDFADRLHNDFIRYREKAMSENADKNGRGSSAVAWVYLGYVEMLKFLKDMSIITAAQQEEFMAEAWRALIRSADAQMQDLKDEKPSAIYIDSVRQLLAAGTVYVRTVGGVPDPNQRGEMIGYADALNYYLLPNVTFGAVQKLRERNGQVFPGTQKQLNRYLKEEKIITPDANGKSTHNKAFGGGQARYLVVPRSIIDGGDADEQVEIPMEELPAEMQG